MTERTQLGTNNNGLGDRLSVNGVHYTLDINSGLTQVLADGTNTYTYGLGRISQTNTSTEYFLGDALGSVRQLTADNGDVTLSKAYDPYGVITTAGGTSQTVYGFTGEYQGDSTESVYLRARFYNPQDGRFQSRDTWAGDYTQPMSYNAWLYTYANPVNYIDPSGLAASAIERLDEIIEKTSPDGARALFQAFEDSELNTTWSNQAGATLEQRLKWLLEVTAGTSRIPSWVPENVGNVLASTLGFQFGKHFGNDCGFAAEFQDSILYPTWHKDRLESNQVGHFLSAVNLTYRYIIPAEISKTIPVYLQDKTARDFMFMGDVALSLIVGHEKSTDDPGVQGALNQIDSVTPDDIRLWYVAVDYDRAGQIASRDQVLWKIMAFRKTTPFEGVEEERVGNSVQDLRLSLKGYRFAKYVWNNKELPPAYGSYWLRVNLSIEKGLLSPFGP